MGPFSWRFGSVALSTCVVGDVFSVSVISMSCSSVGVSCARTSVFCSVGCRSDMNRGETNFSWEYSCSIICLSSLYCGGGRHLNSGGEHVIGCGVCFCRYLWRLWYLTVANTLSMKMLG